MFFMSISMLSCVLLDRLHRDGESGHCAVHSGWPHLVCLHVLLHVGLLGEGSATYDALERLLARMTTNKKKNQTPKQYT